MSLVVADCYKLPSEFHLPRYTALCNAHPAPILTLGLTLGLALHVSKCDTSKSLINTCASGLPFFGNHVKTFLSNILEHERPGREETTWRDTPSHASYSRHPVETPDMWVRTSGIRQLSLQPHKWPLPKTSKRTSHLSRIQTVEFWTNAFKNWSNI